MNVRKLKWFIYTMAFGGILVILRLIKYNLGEEVKFEWVSTTDILGYGLLLNIANLNELEHVKSVLPRQKTIANALSILFVILIVYLFTEYLNEAIRNNVLLIAAFTITGFSIVLSIRVINNLTKTES